MRTQKTEHSLNDPPQPHRIGFWNSLTTRTLIQIAIRISIVVISVAGLSYWHIVSILENEAYDKLTKYITERGNKESDIFLLAEDNHRVFAKKFLQYRALRPDVTEKEFHTFFEHLQDGTTRLRKEVFTGIKRHNGWISRYTTGFIGRNAPINKQEFRNRLLIGYELVDQFGDAWTNRFANVYIAMPENVNIVYWPGVSWAWNADPALDVNTEEWVFIADKKHNPERKTVWTGLYYDQTANEWMVSAETPVDLDGRNLLNVGHDILLNNLFERVFNDHLQDAYNFLFREDGRLIAHPKKVLELEKAAGVLNIDDLNDPGLSAMSSLILASSKSKKQDVFIVEDTFNDALLAVSRIKGPNWFFVMVYPKHLLQSTARSTAEFVLYLGLISLLVELLMLFLVLRNRVVIPLQHFMLASHEVTKGHYQLVASGSIPMPEQRKDEVGMLARTFRQMAISVNDYRDNLEKKVAERTKKLAEATSKAELASEAKSDFLARMSHEIRTPMNAIVGISHLTLKTELTPKQRDYLEKIISSSDTLLKVINDVLDYSKIEAGKLTLESITFDINEVLKNIGTVISLKAQSKGLELLYYVHHDVPQTLVGDNLRLSQILINLANNAVKFTEEGDILIEVELVEKLEEKVQLKFQVKDTGIGIEDSKKTNLFSSFTQADGSISRRFGGSGLGLAICKQLSEMMGGQIDVISSPGQGSCFWFTATFGFEDESTKLLIDKIKGTRVLVVDDNASAREIFSYILNSFDMQVTCVESGAKALDALKSANLKNEPYQLLLLDWNMPGMDGIETARHIHNDSEIREVPAILMITAYSIEEVENLIDEVGIGHLLTKPVSESSLHDSIVEAMLGGDIAELRKKHKEKNKNKATNLLSIKGEPILLVEDSPLNREVALEFLTETGVIVDIAINGHEAVEKVRSKKYSLVLMDIQMPEMDGLSATRLIRSDKHYADLPIVAMTAHAMSGDRERSLAAGMNEHITKPIDPDILYTVLERWIKKGGKSKEKTITKTKKEKSVRKINFPPLKGIDINMGLLNCGYKEPLYLKLLDIFRRSFNDATQQLQDFFDRENHTEAHRLAHTIKSAAANIGAISLSDKAEKLEMALTKPPVKSTLIKDFIDELQTVLETLTDFPPAESVTLTANKDNIDVLLALSILDQLDKFLQQHDSKADKTLEDLRNCLNQDKFVDDFNKLNELIEDIEYEEAGNVVAKIREKITI